MVQTKYWKYTTVVLLVVLLVMIYTNGVPQFQRDGNKEVVVGEAVDYLNDVLLAGLAVAQLEEITVEEGLYKLDLHVTYANGLEEDFVSYLSKDGSLLFPTAIELAKDITEEITEEVVVEEVVEQEIVENETKEVVEEVVEQEIVANETEELEEVVEEAVIQNESSNPDITFTMTGENFKFVMEGEDNPTLTVNEGDLVRIEFTSTDGFHDWVVDEFDVATEQVSNESSTFVEFIASSAGEYEYYCSVGSHRANGMVGKLVVE